MKHTLINNTFCDGRYTVTIGTDLGQFTGSTFCRVEDREHMSDYFGWELAEIKAEIQYARAQRKFYLAQIGALAEFWRDMSGTRTYDQDAFWVKKMRKKLDALTKKRDEWDARITHLKNLYHIRILAFDDAKKISNRKVRIN
jgi:hypothetical protein